MTDKDFIFSDIEQPASDSIYGELTASLPIIDYVPPPPTPPVTSNEE
jgi:hypothetical protein